MSFFWTDLHPRTYHTVTVSRAESPSHSPPVPDPHFQEQLRRVQNATETLNKHRHSIRNARLQIDEQALFGRPSGNTLGTPTRTAAPRTSQQFNPQSLRVKQRSSTNLVPKVSTTSNSNGNYSGRVQPKNAASVANDVTNHVNGPVGPESSPSPGGDTEDSRCLVMWYGEKTQM